MAKIQPVTLTEGDILYTGAQYIYVKDGTLTIEPSGKLVGNYEVEVIHSWEADMHKSAGAEILTQDHSIPIRIHKA